MGCCDSFCRVSFIKYYNIYIIKITQDKLEENLSHEKFINDENEIVNEALNNKILPNEHLLQPQINNKNSNNNFLNLNSKSDKILKNPSEYTFQNNFNNNINNEIHENGNNENHQEVNDLNNYLNNENNNNNNINNINNYNKDIINNKKEDNNNNIINEAQNEKPKKNKIMDRIKKGRKKEENKNDGVENNYKKSEKIQNFANELEKVMFGPKY